MAASIASLPAVDKNGVSVIEEFGIFIDTHRDQPHVGTFTDDIHRGDCRPMMVNYLIEDDYLLDPESGKLIERHEKHLFLEPDAWSAWLVQQLIETGNDPRTGEGTLPTSHFRDPRKKLYVLRSFRQMVAYHQAKKAKK